jgi:NAD(P)-dependent dehydrogenase (short-subunit alcohol dehydrogenase family)
MTAANVQDKHILITGGASGIGAATAKLLAQRGALVSIADLNQATGSALMDEIINAGGKATFISVDVSDSGSVEHMFADAQLVFGDIQVCINNAGIDHLPARLADIDDAVFHRNIAVNLTGVWYCMKHGIKHMLQNGGGHIINIASVAGLHSAPMISPYCAAKHGVVGLTKSAAVEYARANIRFNAVCPSFVRTPMVEGMLAHLDERKAQSLINANPMKRLGEPEEIAFALAWLCSDESSFMTGNSVVLDGGMLA